MDKVCAVFGGSRGIGRAVAQLMAQKGYRLAIVARNLEVAKAAAGDLGGRYGGAVVQLCGCGPSSLSPLDCKGSGSGFRAPGLSKLSCHVQEHPLPPSHRVSR